MKTNIGLWIDHEKAVVVMVTGNNDETRTFSSDIKKHRRQSGIEMPADDRQQSEATEYLNRYYDIVIGQIREANSIFIFGPGEAKGEFKKRLENRSYNGKIVAVEPADNMTDPQIAAKVRSRFVPAEAAWQKG
jgi:stalled ribosome rescue protein Dom34